MPRFSRCLWLTPVLLSAVVAAADPCRVEVVDRENGWPVPLVELRTVHHARFITDNAGVAAIDAPELMDREVWFDVISDGYAVAKDGFGHRGALLTPRRGETLRVEVVRTMPAKRLGRLTGAGLFAESQKCGDHLERPESGVVGCDSVQNAILHGRLFWLWGDTSLFHYPLGIFDSSGATSALPPLDTFEPPIYLEMDYFRNDRDRPRGVAAMPGDGPTWLTGLVTLPDREGNERLVALYSKIDPPLDVYEWGLCVWDEDTERFQRLEVVWRRDERREVPPLPEGHAAFWTDETGQRWVLFGNPLPKWRCPATFEAWVDRGQWETLEPQKALRSPEGEEVRPHTGSIAWHPWRKRWITVFMQRFGKPSVFGELWYAEADAPTGPWGPAVKILSHANYTFYNPRIHAEWFSDDSPVVLFEGTYTAQFADRPTVTPRYDYNQVLYRLDLDDPALRPARSRY